MKTILIIDDFGSVRLFHSALVRGAGAQAVAVASAEEGLTVLAQRPIDGVVLDLVMPGMGGEAWLRRVRAEPRWAELPVVVITSEGAKSHLADRWTRVLIKPVLPAQLLQALALTRTPSQEASR